MHSAAAKEYKRRPGACERCRVKKFRCDGALPKCARCTFYQQGCLYLPCKKRGRKPTQTVQQDTAVVAAEFASGEGGETWWLSQDLVDTPLAHLGVVPSVTPPLDLEHTRLLIVNERGVSNVEGQESVISNAELHEQTGQNLGGSLETQNMLPVVTDTLLNDSFSDQFFDPYFTESLTSSSVGDAAAIAHQESFYMSAVQTASESIDVAHVHSNSQRPLSFSASDILKSLITTQRVDGSISEELANTLHDCLVQSEARCGRRSLAADQFPLTNVDAARTAVHAFCSRPFKGATYIDENALLQITEDVIVERSNEPSKIVLAHAAVAAGMLIERQSGSGEMPWQTMASSYYQHAMNHLRQNRIPKTSVLAFKVSNKQTPTSHTRFQS
ncbi:hypothetical protein GQ44DRAFT_209923 [Phaeosphaeriaceae sp. PMI808]|nr:hypothetical protein GQ44DRAFT_209923 [Phaeosphaeriaceae sp. PMI808]